MKNPSRKTHNFKLWLPFFMALFIALTCFTFSQKATVLGNLIFSTYLGGGLADSGSAITVDQFGSVYIAGITQSIDFPVPASFLAPEHGVDAYVAKLNPGGQNFEYILWFNAQNAADVDEGLGIAVDKMGYAYVTGHTRSADFCSFFGQVTGYDTTYNENGDAFLFKVKPDGSGLVYCTFLGGSDWDSGSAVIVDDQGKAIVTGGTWSVDFPITANAVNQENNGQRDVFLTAFNAVGSALDYSSYFGGRGQEEGRDLVEVDLDQIAITGWTNSTDFPTKMGGFDTSFNGAFDAFLVQFDLSSGQQIYGSFLGSTAEDRAAGIAITKSRQLLVTGTVAATENVLAPQFPTTAAALSTELQGHSDAFVTKFNAPGTRLAYSTLIGGSGEEQGLGIAVNDLEAFAITGSTTSSNFPTTDQAYQSQYIGLGTAEDIFISQFNPSGNFLLYSSYFGGDQEDIGQDLFLTAGDQIYLTGATRSADFPVSPQAYSLENAGDYDAFITHLDLPQTAIFEIDLPLVLRD